MALPDLGLGTAPLAGLHAPVSIAGAHETLDAAWNAGIRFFDTAPHYGHGRAERIVGDFLRERKPESYVLSTKVGRILRPAAGSVRKRHSFVDPLPFDQRFDYSHDGIMRSVQDSYQRLGLNKIDIILAHDIGAYTHGDGADRFTRQLVSDGARALRRLRESGEIASVGIGVNEVEICARLMDEIPIDIILLAGRHTLLDRTAEQALLPRCQERGIGLVIGGAFNSGVLATGSRPGARWNYGPAPREVLDEVARLERVCEAHGISLPEAALAFPRRNPAVQSMLLGCASKHELNNCLKMLARGGATRPSKEFWSEVSYLGLRPSRDPS